MSSPHKFPKPKPTSEHSASSKKSSVRPSRNPAALWHNGHFGLQAASDGFVGAERLFTHIKRPVRREARIPAKKTTLASNLGLHLRSGLLPTPSDQQNNVLFAEESGNPQDQRYPQSLSGADSLGIEPTGSQQSRQNRLLHMQRQIHDKLSSVIAPPRQESEDTDSDHASEDCSQSNEGDEEEHTDDSDNAMDSRSIASTVLVSPTDRTRFLGNTMQLLDVATTMGYVEDDDFWTLYGMD